ncbi:M20 family metallopeptidase [Niallia sp. Sow4_A1]|uniref:M20 family metallopeptidase n=1 Tax=Niallia sp. Sow4_A1 TaxID=3438793 RepID=UPI003F95EDFF
MQLEDLSERVLQAFNSNELFKIVKDLISIPSHTNSENKEIEIAKYLFEIFESEKIDVYLQEICEGRSNVIATLKGEQEGTSLMFNGHIDTVPPLAMENPFTPIEREGKMYGRGSADMKSGVAAMAYALIVLKRLGIKLKGDLVFAGVIDEESSRSAGTKYIVENGPKTDLAIVGEPTNLHPVIAHKGCNYYEVTFSGTAVHSSVPEEGANAISAATYFIRLIEESLAFKYKKLSHPYLSPPTVTVNLIMGGSEGNMAYLTDSNSALAGTVADFCKVYLDVRYIPYQTPEEIVADLDYYAKLVEKNRAKIKTEVKAILPHPAMEINADHQLVQVVQNSLTKGMGIEKSVSGATYWGDSGFLNGISKIPTLLFGPGDIGCAHSDNEFIESSQIQPASIVYALTAIEICGIYESN